MEGEGEVTKNPKKVEAGKKAYQARLLKMKEEILRCASTGSNATNTGTNAVSNATNAGSNSGRRYW